MAVKHWFKLPKYHDSKAFYSYLKTKNGLVVLWLPALAFGILALYEIFEPEFYLNSKSRHLVPWVLRLGPIAYLWPLVAAINLRADLASR